MEQILRNYIQTCGKLDVSKHHALIKLFDKELVHKEIDSYLETKVETDFSFENQDELWERFGYYLATLDSSVFEKRAILETFLKNDSRLLRKDRGGLSLEEEKKYGYHLLSRDYIMICLDGSDSKVDMMKVFASIRHVEVRDIILKRFQEMYQTISRVSNYDNEMKAFLENYRQLCGEKEIPNLDYQGEILDEEVLVEQVDMYVRYSIAKDKFLQANNGLIFYVCNLYFEEVNDDFLVEGYFGLLRAVEKFDVRKGFLFSTYATKAIKLAIRRYYDNSSSFVRLPGYLGDLAKKMDQFYYQFYNEYNRFPTAQEVALKLEVSVERIFELKSWVEQTNCVSLNQKIVKDSDEIKSLEFIDAVCDETVQVEKKVIDKEYMEYIYALIDSNLNEKEKYILFERAKNRTLNDIGMEFGVTRERVRQIEEIACKKLRRIPGIGEYNPFSK